jgi:hypothetical protein
VRPLLAAESKEQQDEYFKWGKGKKKKKIDVMCSTDFQLRIKIKGN